MDCSQVLNLIPQYCKDELDDETRRQVEEHLSGCPNCSKEVERDHSLGEIIGHGSCEDPPGEYWDDYNDRLRSRIRGAVAISWRLGCLPGCLIGTIAGWLATSVFLWLWFEHGRFAEIHPDWLRMLVWFALVIAISVGIGGIIRPLFLYVNRRVVPRFQRDELNLKRLIAERPLGRAVYVGALIMVHLGLSLLVSIFWFQLSEHTPLWAQYAIAILVFLGFASHVPRYYRSLRNDIAGRPVAPTPTRRRFWQVVIVGLLIVPAFWNLGVTWYLAAPTDCREQAEAAYESGNAASAISILRSGVRRYGDRYRVLECYEYLGEIYEETGRREQALNAYREGARVYERLVAEPKFYYSKGDKLRFLAHAARLYIRLGQNRKALELYTVKLQMAPNDPENMYFVAWGYEAAGYHDKAKALYTRIVLEFPHGTWTDSAREALRGGN